MIVDQLFHQTSGRSKRFFSRVRTVAVSFSDEAAPEGRLEADNIDTPPKTVGCFLSDQLGRKFDGSKARSGWLRIQCEHEESSFDESEKLFFRT
jgi:hypothetical protein